ncbi:MAG: helix-turn-helix transcriptional regulator [Tepidiformaceae bacterium]
MRADRLVTILLLLGARGRVSAPALAAAMEVSERTILRDMDALATAGVPVVAVRGPGGGFEMLGRPRIGAIGLTPDETAALHLAGLPEVARILGFGTALARAAAKLDAISTDAAQRDSRALVDRFHFDLGTARNHSESVAFLRESIWRQREVRARVAGQRPAIFDPLGLVLKGEQWFAVVREVDRLTALRVEHLAELANTGRRFKRPVGFDLAAAWGARTEN